MTMSDTTATDVGEAASSDSASANGRKRRRYRFPYSHLDDAVKVADAVFKTGGSSCDLADLAAPLDSTTTSSSFRTKLSTAKTFGVLAANRRGVAELTDLGRRILDESTADAARAEAFLRVPLYAKLYEDHKGGLLPGDQGLEAEMVRLGVPDKSATKARQVFQRSAEQAGFFGHGRNRLTKPSAATVDPDIDDGVGDEDVQDDNGTGRDGHDKAPAMSHPLLAGVLAQLPAPGDQFTPDQQSEWLELMDRALKWVYGTDESNRGGVQHVNGQQAG